MENDILEIKQAEMLAGITRSEIDIQIATAKQYPRDLNTVLNKIATYATMDRETAEDCFYVLRRKDANGNDNTIEGLSIRMAEIIAGAWGNLRVQTRIIGNDGRKITAQAVCHDLETNFAVCKTVDRRITTKTGKTYSDDMQVVTGNAAASIAFRNAVLAVIPKAVTKRVINEVKKVALGQAIDVETSRKNCLANFAKAGVTEAMICQYLGIKAIAEIDKEKLFELRATWNAIKEGKNVLLEGQLGSLKDPDHGIYPMVTSSSTLAGYGAIGAGIPPYEIKKIITVCKAYSSAVGAGAFVSEIFGEEADELRRRGGDGGEGLPPGVHRGADAGRGMGAARGGGGRRARAGGVVFMQAEAADGLRQRLALLVQALRAGARLVDQARVLARHVVDLRQRAVDAGDLAILLGAGAADAPDDHGHLLHAAPGGAGGSERRCAEWRG